ncbi:hypothetical protein [Cohnella sp. WQ 127256]|uniref:hypothetical protein n=1 Tax=Cohnella sp. WQ 127256 TaxID=2938790 RepID=UPI002118106A|nr:hypothetical protein [Cohnella sp. WQ 127256]
MESVLNIGIATFVISVLIIILKAIGLMNSSRLERLLLTDYKRLLAYISEYLIIVFVMCIGVTSAIVSFSGIKQPEVVVALFLSIFLFANLLSILIYNTRHWIIKETTVYYVEDNDQNKLYIHKAVSESEILLSRSPIFNRMILDNILIRPRIILHDKTIKSEKVPRRP